MRFFQHCLNITSPASRLVVSSEEEEDWLSTYAYCTSEEEESHQNNNCNCHYQNGCIGYGVNGKLLCDNVGYCDS